MIQLYKNIRNRRIELGMTQDELARLVGYSDRTSIAKIESGKVDLQQSKISLFAKALNTTPSDLMGWEDEESVSEEVEIKTIAAHAISNLSEDQIKKVIEYAKFIKSQEGKS